MKVGSMFFAKLEILKFNTIRSIFMYRQKVFILGVHKTGTNTLRRALEIFGYKVTGPDPNLMKEYKDGNYKNIYKYLEKYDAFQDDPWFMMYEKLYELYPSGKFILIDRDDRSWIKSVQKFYDYSSKAKIARNYFYGSLDPYEDESSYIEAFRSHRKHVKTFFGKNENFIHINLKDYNAFQNFKEFLGITSGTLKDFPVINSTPKTKWQVRKRKFFKFFHSFLGITPMLKKLTRYLFGEDIMWALREKLRFCRTWFKSKFFSIFNW
jgi:hypothetical protein